MLDERAMTQSEWRLPLARQGSGRQAVCIPAQVAAALQVTDGHTLQLRAGSATVRVPVQVAEEKEAEYLALNSSVMAGLGLAPGQSVHVQLEQGKLRLGPVVGILAPRRTGLAKPYQAQTSLFKRIIMAARELGIVLYVFDFHDIRWSTKRVRGYSLAGGAWTSRLYPLPDVVFDRAMGSFPGGSGAADTVRRKLTQQYGVKIFNTRLGNKLRMHKLMQADPMLRSHLPPTKRITGTAVVAGVLANHRGAYLKPQNGAQGKGIIRLRKAPGGIQYTLTTDSYQRVQGRTATVAGALAELRSRVRLSGYLVQPELSLIRIDGRICDVRALVQRDADGAWHLTGIGVRAGQTGSVVSNLHGGGRALKVENVLKKALNAPEAEVRRITVEIEQLALRVGEVLSRATRCLGELGVDLGIDTKGRIWIIEANSRTGRATFRKAGLPDAASLADRRPLLFAKYLADFSS